MSGGQGGRGRGGKRLCCCGSRCVDRDIDGSSERQRRRRSRKDGSGRRRTRRRQGPEGVVNFVY